MDRIAAIALGSNLGDRRAHLDFAVTRLRTLLDGLIVSDYFDTAFVAAGPSTALGAGPSTALGADIQPRYLNAAAVGRPPSDLTPRALLAALLAIERERGRERPHPSAPRTLDLDLVLFGDVVLKEPGLEVPHPRFRERAFVLQPLAAIAPDLRDPITGATVAELLDRSRSS